MSVKDKIQGKGEELKGKITGDKAEELKGKGRQGIGELKDAGREIRDKAEGRDQPKP